MARFWLFLLVMTCTAGCFDAPPEYSEPTRVPPVIAADKCAPPTTQLVPATTDTEFDVAFRADDADLLLKARLIRDLTLGQREVVAYYDIPSDPRPFADQTLRTAPLLWQWTLDGARAFGCHTVTAIITDVNNFDGLYGSKNALEEARITWFVWIRDPATGSDEKPPVDCLYPKSPGVTP